MHVILFTSSGQESGAAEMQPWSQQDCDDLFMVYQDHADRPLSEALHPILIDLADKGIIKSECEVNISYVHGLIRYHFVLDTPCDTLSVTLYS